MKTNGRRICEIRQNIKICQHVQNVKRDPDRHVLKNIVLPYLILCNDMLTIAIIERPADFNIIWKLCMWGTSDIEK